MIYVNNFRYGKISRKMAGRFDSEQYNQGAFTFRNVMSLFDGGVTRRKPLRHMLNANDSIRTSVSDGVERIDPNGNIESFCNINVLRGFTISDNDSYIVGIGTRMKNGVNESVAVLYEKDMKISVKAIVSLSEAASIYDSNGNRTSVLLDEDVCRKIRFAQYYNRLYVVSHEFRTFYLDYVSGTFSSHSPQFIFNNDSKSNICYINGDALDDSGKKLGDGGRLLIKHMEDDGSANYYYSTEYTNPDKRYTGPIGTDPQGVERILEADQGMVSGFADFEDNSFNTTVGTYPSVIAVINDSLWLANTISNPNAIWKSRVLGSSQWVEGLDADTMHDFTQFQVVATEQTKLKDKEDWPRAIQYDSSGNVMYHQQSGSDKFFSRYDYRTDGTKHLAYDLDATGTPHIENGDTLWIEDSEGDPYFTYDDGHRLIREGKYYVQYGYGYQYTKYGTNKRYLWYDAEHTPTYERDPVTNEYEYFGIDGNGDKIKLVRSDVTSYSIDDYNWYWAQYIDSDGRIHKFDDNSKEDFSYELYVDYPPVRQKYETYSFSTESVLYEESTTIDMIATDSCSVRLELNTGREDAIMAIDSGCERILVSTTNAVWTLPSNFSAVSNLSASRYSGLGGADLDMTNLNRTILCLQRGSILVEYYVNNGYLMTREATGLNHDLIDSKVIDAITKSAPDPEIYMVMDNGQLIYGLYDYDAALGSFANWDMDYEDYTSSGVVETKGKFKSVAMFDAHEVVVALVELDGEKYLCEFCDSPEDWHDEVEEDSKHTFVSEIETTYIEINAQNLMFGREKKTKGAWIRPYECGRIMVGNDRRQMTLTNFNLGSKDYYSPMTGKSDKSFAMCVKSYLNEPMTILALGWEVEN